MHEFAQQLQLQLGKQQYAELLKQLQYRSCQNFTLYPGNQDPLSSVEIDTTLSGFGRKHIEVVQWLYRKIYNSKGCYFDGETYFAARHLKLDHKCMSRDVETIIVGLCQSGKSAEVVWVAWLAWYVFGVFPVIFVRNVGGRKQGVVDMCKAIEQLNTRVKRLLDSNQCPQDLNKNDKQKFEMGICIDEKKFTETARRRPVVLVMLNNSKHVRCLIQSFKTRGKKHNRNSLANWADQHYRKKEGKSRILMISDEDDLSVSNPGRERTATSMAHFHEPRGDAVNTLRERVGARGGGYGCVSITATPMALYITSDEVSSRIKSNIIPIDVPNNYLNYDKVNEYGRYILREMLPARPNQNKTMYPFYKKAATHGVLGMGASMTEAAWMLMENRVRHTGHKEDFEMHGGFFSMMRNKTGSLVVQPRRRSAEGGKTKEIWNVIKRSHNKERKVNGKSNCAITLDGENIIKMVNHMLDDEENYRHGLVITDKTKQVQQQSTLADWVCNKFKQRSLVVITWNCNAIRVLFTDQFKTLGEFSERLGKSNVKQDERGYTIQNADIQVVLSVLTNAGILNVLIITGQIGGRGVSYHDLEHRRILTDMFIAFDVPETKQVTAHAELWIQIAGRLNTTELFTRRAAAAALHEFYQQCGAQRTIEECNEECARKGSEEGHEAILANLRLRGGVHSCMLSNLSQEFRKARLSACPVVRLWAPGANHRLHQEWLKDLDQTTQSVRRTGDYGAGISKRPNLVTGHKNGQHTNSYVARSTRRTFSKHDKTMRSGEIELSLGPRTRHRNVNLIDHRQEKPPVERPQGAMAVASAAGVPEGGTKSLGAQHQTGRKEFFGWLPTANAGRVSAKGWKIVIKPNTKSHQQVVYFHQKANKWSERLRSAPDVRNYTENNREAHVEDARFMFTAKKILECAQNRIHTTAVNLSSSNEDDLCFKCEKNPVFKQMVCEPCYKAWQARKAAKKKRKAKGNVLPLGKKPRRQRDLA